MQTRATAAMARVRIKRISRMIRARPRLEAASEKFELL